VRGLQRPSAHLVRGDRRKGRVVLLPRADADDAFDRLNEDLPVTDFAGAGALHDRVDRRLHVRLGADHLDLDLVLELEHDGTAAIVLEPIGLTPVAARAAQRDAGDAGLKQRFLDGGKPLRADDAGDQLHLDWILESRVMSVSDLPIFRAPVRLGHMRSPHVVWRFTGAGGAHTGPDVLRSARSRLALVPVFRAHPRLAVGAAIRAFDRISAVRQNVRMRSGLPARAEHSRPIAHDGQTRTTKSQCQA